MPPYIIVQYLKSIPFVQKERTRDPGALSRAQEYH